MKNEKQNIEYHTACGFLDHYNQHLGADYSIYEINDAPDIRCKDSKGNILNLEITTTEDSDGDIICALGRSDKKSLPHLKEHLKRVREGKETIKINSLSGNVNATLFCRIEAKLMNDYGNNVALVIRDTSGVDWDWDYEISTIAERLSGKRNPFDKGIWLLNRAMTRLFKIV
ncbi:MAG TPA: hypothetical protein VLH56_02330 [Dissulfurispiraceae bacterium]|nr:hypothetical protein [Dissulfurispiraceae bacterium]